MSSILIMCPGCENGLDSDNMHRDHMGEYYDDCYMNRPEEFKHKKVTINTADYRDPNKCANDNIKEVMNYNKVSKEEAMEMMITDVVENVIRFVDKIDKPDIDYIRVLLQQNNWDIMKCVDILEEEENEWNKIKKKTNCIWCKKECYTLHCSNKCLQEHLCKSC